MQARRGQMFAVASLGLAAVSWGVGASVDASTEPPATSAAEAADEEWPSLITDYVEYTGGTDGPADESLEPVRIGWVNNEGGSIPPPGPTTTLAAETAVQYINEHLGGIGGHPVELVECFVKNAEEEGLDCAQQFLNDDDIHVIAYGGVGVGGDTIASTIAGQKPVIQSVSLNPSDATNENTYILFGTAQLTLSSVGSFARDYLGAETASVLFPEGGGNADNAQFIQDGLLAAGVDSQIVGYDPDTSDFIGALTAAGAQDADMINLIMDGDDCVRAAQAIEELGLTADIHAFTECVNVSLREGYGGDFPLDWYYSITQSGDALLTDPPSPAGEAFTTMLEGYGLEDHSSDPWWTATISEIFTVAKFLNGVGFDNLSPEAVAEQAASFTGPLMLGPSELACGVYSNAPASCSDAQNFYQYKGDGRFERVGGWQHAPEELREELANG